MDASRLTPAQRRELVQQLFVERVPEIRRFVTATVPDIARVDAVIQHAFKALSADAAFYDPAQSFTAWLHPKLRQAVAFVTRDGDAGSQPFSAEVLDSLVASRPDGVNSMVVGRLLQECVGTLAPQARRIVELRYRNAMKPREVARLMGWTNGSVHVALSRARAVLRECIDHKLAAVRG